MQNKAVFLDRDGVINVDKGYIYKIEDIEFVDGMFEVVKRFYDQGYLILIITNQAGIGRGYYSEKDFEILMIWMKEEFQKRGILISKVYYSPYHPIHGIGKYKKDSNCRKPNPGMLLKAKNEFNLDLEKSVLIGDKQTDIVAGRNAGLKHNFLFNDSVKVGNYRVDKLEQILGYKLL